MTAVDSGVAGTPTTSDARLPLDPLIRACGSGNNLAALTGYRRARLTQWQRDGVPVCAADNMAVALGMHPIELWPDWYEIDAAA